MTRSSTPLGRKLLEVLGDGEWHEGRPALLEIGKAITPGVAQRMTESQRTRKGGAAGERRQQMSLARQIEQGKRYILTELIRARVKSGTVEIDPPWPLNHGLFDANRPWRLRLVRGTQYLTPPQVAERLGVPARTIRMLAKEQGLPATNVGTTREMLRIDAEDLPMYEKAAREWLRAAPLRQVARTRGGAETRVERSIRDYLNDTLGPSNTPVMTRVRETVDELLRLRRLLQRLQGNG